MELPAAPIQVGALLAECRTALGERHELTLLTRLLAAQAKSLAGRLQDAEEAYRAVAADAAAAYGPACLVARVARASLTGALAASGRCAEAVGEAEWVLAETGPASYEAQEIRRTCLVNRSYALLRLGDHEHALADLDAVAAMDEARRMSGAPVSPAVSAGVYINRALAHLADGRPEAAERSASAAVAVLAPVRSHGTDHTTLLEAHITHARTLLALGRGEEAGALAADAAARCAQRHGAEHPLTLQARFVHAEALAGTGRDDDARAEHAAVLDLRRRVLRPDHPDTRDSSNATGSS